MKSTSCLQRTRRASRKSGVSSGTSKPQQGPGVVLEHEKTLLGVERQHPPDQGHVHAVFSGRSCLACRPTGWLGMGIHAAHRLALNRSGFSGAPFRCVRPARFERPPHPDRNSLHARRWKISDRLEAPLRIASRGRGKTLRRGRSPGPGDSSGSGRPVGHSCSAALIRPLSILLLFFLLLVPFLFLLDRELLFVALALPPFVRSLGHDRRFSFWPRAGLPMFP